MEHQDWTPIYLNADKMKLDKDRDKQNQPKTISKENKLEKQIEDGNLSHKKMDANYGKELQKKRLSKGMTQKDIALKINVSVKVITEIEAGKAKHNGQIMNKINRIMK